MSLSDYVYRMALTVNVLLSVFESTQLKMQSKILKSRLNNQKMLCHPIRWLQKMLFKESRQNKVRKMKWSALLTDLIDGEVIMDETELYNAGQTERSGLTLSPRYQSHLLPQLLTVTKLHF